MAALDPVVELERIAFLLEAALEPSYRVKAFRNAARTLRTLPTGEIERRAETGTLKELIGVGDVTERVITDALAGDPPDYLRRLEATDGKPIDEAASALRAALKGDCHTHSDWSDGGSPIEEMARAAIELGHEYLVLTDHSPRLKVARGLSPERLREQLDVVARLNVELAPFRILTGIEVDIFEDGGIDQEPELLARLDVVVASVHSKLRMTSAEMTPRMVAAIANPYVDILGHCTGRNVMPRGAKGKTRPESEFDAEIVFAACEKFDVAVEINCRPERQDPPERLLRLVVEAGCHLSIDTDAHAPGQLSWQPDGCERAVRCGVTADMVVNTKGPDDLIAWASARRT